MYTDGAGFISFCILAVSLMLAVASTSVLVQSLNEMRLAQGRGSTRGRPARRLRLSCLGLLGAVLCAALGVWLLS
ncbi:hypothetical protein [Alkalilimnicola sp. S0819]|uniref:hypothetical protein n=1 Tax=Alkalilimnicola sp. S0819 TaxID=2613922 RepID=UPI00126245CC|nr:hypothetical protein [Alkalilimnicola sp. S0819]KAB7628452.1 hypothetical protein F3N43_01785 [Alkalilimnicola sp. S0819]MPQ15357.1 hypothetical protein [Alkalilimnicola sp. S0819]